jgi:hypothetical protein
MLKILKWLLTVLVGLLIVAFLGGYYLLRSSGHPTSRLTLAS